MRISSPFRFSLVVCALVLAAVYGLSLLAPPPGPRMVGAVAHITPCGVLGVVEVQSDGNLVVHREYPGPEFDAALEALPEDQLVVVTLPCPTPQAFPNQYEANKENRAKDTQARAPQGDVADRPHAG